ncbi:MAG: 3'-5' exonuclease [Oscillospiraceae bacterium]
MIPPNDWTRFASATEKLEFLKDLELVPRTHNYLRRFIYKGAFKSRPEICTVEGYASPTTLVVEVCGELHCINADYLQDMQAGCYRAPETYIVLDLETTGLSPKKDSILEFAGVKYKNGVELDSFETLINPECELSPLAEAVNGISADMVRDAPCLGEALPKIRDFLGKTPVVAHNASFDYNFLNEAYHAFGWTMENAVFDTLSLSRKAFPAMPNYKLATLKEQLDIRVSAAHRALPDVYATAQLFEACARALDEAGTV